MPDNRLNKTRDAYDENKKRISFYREELDSYEDLEMYDWEVKRIEDHDRDYGIFIMGVFIGLLIAIILIRFVA